MAYSYKIIHNIKKDAANWYDASKNSFCGFSWRDDLTDPDDLKVFDQVACLKKKEAVAILLDYLPIKIKKLASQIKKNTTKLEREMKADFSNACHALEKITGKPPFFKKYLFSLTTFPRCPYDPETGEIYFFVSGDSSWLQPINTFMHEAIHFQFHHYWQDNKKSPVAKLSPDDFDLLKESLTVVLDGSLPFTKQADYGYPAHQRFRQFLYKKWQQDHDFSNLVEYGLANINNKNVVVKD